MSIPPTNLHHRPRSHIRDEAMHPHDPHSSLAAGPALRARTVVLPARSGRHAITAAAAPTAAMH